MVHKTLQHNRPKSNIIIKYIEYDRIAVQQNAENPWKHCALQSSCICSTAVWPVLGGSVV